MPSSLLYLLLLFFYPIIIDCYCGLQMYEDAMLVSCNDMESYYQCERAYSQYEGYFNNLAQINSKLDKSDIYRSKCAEYILCVDYDFATYKPNNWGKLTYLCGNMDSIQECSEIDKKVSLLASDSTLNKTNVPTPKLTCGSTKLASINNLNIYKYSIGDKFADDNAILGISQILTIMPLIFIYIF